MNGESFGVAKKAVAVSISRDMAIDFGLIPPTARERVEREASAARWRDYEERCQRADGDMLASLRAVEDRATKAILDLHQPEDRFGTRSCQGDDFGGYEAEAPEWPCRTIIALAKAHAIPTREDVQR